MKTSLTITLEWDSTKKEDIVYKVSSENLNNKSFEQLPSVFSSFIKSNKSFHSLFINIFNVMDRNDYTAIKD